MPEAPSAQATAPAMNRWLALTLLALAVVLAMSPWFSAAAVLPQLRAEWALSPRASAWLTLAVQLGFVAGALTSAALNLADRVPPRALIPLGALGAAAANLALLAAGGPLTAFVLRALTGAALALVYPPALKAMSAYFVKGRGLALGIMVGALTLGSAMPHLVNGLGGANWQLVILITSLQAALGGVLAATVPPGPTRFPPAAFRPAQAWQVLRARPVALATLGYLGHMWELYAMWAWFAVFYGGVLSSRNLPGAATGASLATFTVVGLGALGCVAGGLLGDGWGRTRLTALAMWLSGGSALTLAFVLQAPLAVILTVSLFWGFWIVADSAQFSTIVSEVADPAYVGTALTAQLALGFTLTAISIALVPLLETRIGWPGVFLTLSIGPFLGAWAMTALRRTPDAARIAGGKG